MNDSSQIPNQKKTFRLLACRHISIMKRKLERRKYMKKLREQITNDIARLMSLFISNGYEIYCVGGCVRDALLDMEPEDIDMTTDATPKEMIDMFERNDIHFARLGEKFGTLTAHLSRMDIEITTFRTEDNYADNRHCDVRFVRSLKEDLSRRDFTINAMAYDFFNDALIDYFGGKDDLVRKRIRAVGNLKRRCSEDNLRILRYFRFAFKYGLEMDTSDYKEIISLINNGAMENISGERIQNELLKIFNLDTLTEENLDKLFPVLSAVFPPLKVQWGFDQKNPYHEFFLWDHTAKTVVNVKKAFDQYPELAKNKNMGLIRIAALLHDIGKPYSAREDDVWKGIYHYYNHAEISSDMAKSMLKDDLRFSNRDVDYISSLVRHHGRFLSPTRKSIRKAARHIGEDRIEDLLLLMLADKSSQSNARGNEVLMKEVINKYQNTPKPLLVDTSKIAVNGNDIMTEFKLESSPVIGKILNKIRDAIDEEKLENNYENIMRFVRENIVISKNTKKPGN